MNSYERIFSVLTEGGKGMMDKRRVRRYRREQAEAPKNYERAGFPGQKRKGRNCGG